LKRQTLYAIRKLKDAQGQYLWVPGFSAGLAGSSPALIDGMPYLQTPDMPDVAANALPVALGDFKRGYVISDRVVMSAQRDPYTQNRLGNCRFTFRKRVGGQVVLPEAIKLGKVAA
jgi:HK97 family phage major capsid protein